MTKDEALRMALEALLWANEEINGWMDDAQGLDPVDHPEIMSAVFTINEALAQQCVCCESNSAGMHRTDGPCLAPQRTWVGLTDDDIDYLYETTESVNWGRSFARVIEAKLKEKNI